MNEKISGIYWIKNIIDNKLYVGSSINLKKRKQTHFSFLKTNKHGNIHLQSAYNKYGKENFVFEMLIQCQPELLLFYEQQFIDQLKPEYNHRLFADNNFGVKRTKETKMKISQTLKGRIVPEETKLKLLGRKLTEETKLKMSIAHKGKPQSINHRKACSLARTGSQLSEETKQKIKVANLGRKPSEETRLKLSQCRLGKHLKPKTEEQKRKISEALLLYWKERKEQSGR